jgi:peptide/nickel transport system substrate-binding protein
LNYQKYPTDNKKFRQALTHIWDYERIIKEILLGYAELAKGPIPTTLWGANTNLDMPKFDLEKARKLLDESGIPPADRKIIILPESTDEEMKNACIVFQNDASKVGVKVEIEAGPFNAIVDRMRNLDNSAHAFLVNWPSAYPTPSDVLYAGFRTEDPTFWNLGHYANAEFDKALDQAIELEGTDREASIKKYHETQKILVEDAAAIFQSTYKMKVAFRSDIKGTYMNPNYWPPFFKNFYSDN